MKMLRIMRSMALMAALAGGALAVTSMSGCETAYYATWAKLGWEKRDILIDRVKDARNDQQAAKTQFQTTLQRFRAVTGAPEDSLQARYDKLSADYDSCASRAKAVHERIASVDEVAQDMFKEWNSELSEYHDPNLRAASEQELTQTQARYAELIGAMRRADDSMQPVLGAFHDQVLFLKHNLNARAIASLETTRASIETDVAALIKEMDASIAQADSFINDMHPEK